MSLTHDVDEQLEALGHPAMSSTERAKLTRSPEWADLRAGLYDEDVAVRDCADAVLSWRREVHLEQHDAAARVRARSLALYAIACTEPEVDAFRREELGGTVLAYDAMRSWVEQRRRLGPMQGYPDLRLPFDDLRTVRVEPDSTLGRLHDLCASLADLYRWQEGQAVAFVLADAVPVVSDIRATVRSSSSGTTIHLEMDLTAPPEEVRDQYAKLQRELLGRSMRLPKPSSFDAVSDYVLHGGSDYRSLARAISRRGTSRSAKWCRTTVARTWEWLTGEELSAEEVAHGVGGDDAGIVE